MWPLVARNVSKLSSGGHWISDHTVPGCAPGINLGASNGVGNAVGGYGGYGGSFCFALTA